MPPLCKTCGRPFDIEIEDEAICASCLREAPQFDLARSALRYEGKGRALVLSLKNHRSFVGAPALAKLMVTALADKAAFDIVTPVPLHTIRLLTRRFNQAQLLAQALSKRLQINMDAGLIVRTKHRPKQGTLARDKRQKNVQGVFALTRHGREFVPGKRILLVDDVLTTGSTINECAKLLKKAKAKEVIVVTLARADRAFDG